MNKQSWVEINPNSDFSIHNIPFGIYKSANGSIQPGSALGDYVIDLNYLHAEFFFSELELPDDIFSHSTLNNFIGLGRKKTGAVRKRIIELFSADNQEIQGTKKGHSIPVNGRMTSIF